MKQNAALRRLNLFAVILAFAVILMGAYTRLADAGLGCPDWPGCYNQLIAPSTATAIHKATAAYPNTPVHVAKAWIEMTHRYIAGFLGLLIFSLGIMAIGRKEEKASSIIVPVVLMGMVIFQALLGKWTVTMKLLPLVVASHLMGGLTILALLWWLNLQTGNYFDATADSRIAALKGWAILGLLIVVVQIALGGWTSTHYAALICPAFPYCSGQGFFPAKDFPQAFNVFNMTYPLNYPAMITIQMTHRIGALVTAVYLGIIGVNLLLRSSMRKLGLVILVTLVAQIVLGIVNIKLHLPLSAALLHNAFAALLLLTMVTFVYLTFRCSKIS